MLDWPYAGLALCWTDPMLDWPSLNNYSPLTVLEQLAVKNINSQGKFSKKTCLFCVHCSHVFDAKITNKGVSSFSERLKGLRTPQLLAILQSICIQCYFYTFSCVKFYLVALEL